MAIPWPDRILNHAGPAPFMPASALAGVPACHRPLREPRQRRPGRRIRARRSTAHHPEAPLQHRATRRLRKCPRVAAYAAPTEPPPRRSDVC